MLNRRDAMIRLGQVGLGAMTLPQLCAASTPSRRAKSCIYIFLWGGPPQQDLWDLKPDAPAGIRSEFKPIDTSVPGIRICDQMPLLAQRMKHVAVVRSLTHPSNVHEASVYHMLTGKPNPGLAMPRNVRRRGDFPNFASVLARQSPLGAMPASVTIPRPIGHDGVTYSGTYAGFLGPRYDPFEPRAAAETKNQPSHPVGLPDDVNVARLQARLGLLRRIEQGQAALDRGRTGGLDAFQEQAFQMISSPRAKRAFNVNSEPPTVRDRYGRNEYGDSFLLARRLIEAGVRLVSVNWMYIKPSGDVSNVWDNHSGVGVLGCKTGYDLLRSAVCIPTLDRAYAALLDDLSDRGLLDDTLVVAVGEFGRTPKINKTAGRDHWGACQSALLAGGGVKGGQVHGRSDAQAAYPADDPVSPEDLIATIHHAVGLAPDHEIHDQTGRPVRACDGKPLAQLFA